MQAFSSANTGMCPSNLLHSCTLPIFEPACSPVLLAAAGLHCTQLAAFNFQTTILRPQQAQRSIAMATGWNVPHQHHCEHLLYPMRNVGILDLMVIIEDALGTMRRAHEHISCVLWLLTCVRSPSQTVDELCACTQAYTSSSTSCRAGIQIQTAQNLTGSMPLIRLMRCRTC